MTMRQPVPLVLSLILAGCALKFQPASNVTEIDEAKAQWDCQQHVLQVRLLNPAQADAVQIGERFHHHFMIDCMRAKGYEVAK